MKFPYPIVFFIGAIVFANIERKMKKRINDEFIFNNNSNKKVEK